MALSSLKCNGTISFVYVKSGGRIMQISGRSDSLCIFLYEMDFRFDSQVGIHFYIPLEVYFLINKRKEIVF